MTTAKAASNGSPGPAGRRERASGVTRVCEAQAYHLASVAHDAAFEAERLCNDIYRAASDARFADAADSGSTLEALADPAIIRKAEEAVICLATSVLYLTDLFHGNLPS
jgi:hypothetical protein